MNNLSLNDNNNEISDEMLIREVAKGSMWAMNPLVERYSGIFYAIVNRMVLNHHITEDLLQEIFILIWNRAKTYNPASGSARNWLITIARNRAIDYLRSARRHSALQQVTWEDVERDESTAQPDAEGEALKSIESEQIRMALRRLPPEQREVIELGYFQAWTHSEIANECKIPLGTVKARMRLAVKRLRHELIQMGLIQPDN